GSGSRTRTFVASWTPLFPTTNVYVRPPRQSAVPKFGNDRAQTGLGVPTLEMVRSRPALMMVCTSSRAVYPVFLMFALTAALLMIVEPAGATTMPSMTTVIVSGWPVVLAESRVMVQVTVGAATVQTGTVPLVAVLLTTRRLAAWRPCVPSVRV